MKSLFFRIFLTLLITIVSVASSAIYLTRWYYHKDHTPQIPEPMMQQVAEDATRTLHQHGRRHLRLWLRELRKEQEINAFLFTDRLEPIATRIPRFLRHEFGALKQQVSQKDVRSSHDIDDDDVHWHEDNDDHPRNRFQWMRTQRDGKEYVFAAAYVPKPFKKRNMLVQSITLMFAFILIGSLLIAWLVAAPLRRLQKATRAFAVGEWDSRANRSLQKRRDVIGDLGREFNHMAESISSLISGQQRLLRDISHELRTPLARMRVAVELIPSDTQQARSAVARMRTEVERLDSLIGQVLSLTRLKGGFESFNEHTFDLMQTLANIVDDAEYEYADQQKSVQLSGPDQWWVHVDEAKVASAIENLVRNALRYSPDSAPVHLSLESHGQHFCVRVEDRGPGVPEADLPKLFDAFYRVQEARDRESGGHGVGLAIAKGLAEHYGGHLEAHNRAEGGLSIALCLPAKTRATEPPPRD